MLGLYLGLGLRSNVGGFSLKDVSGLHSWYPFNTGHTLDGVNLVEWADSSGNNNTLFNTSATNRRPTVNNGVVDWSHTGGVYMDTTALTPSSNEFTLFFVVELDVVYSTTRFSRFGQLDVGSTDLVQWGTLSSSATSQLWQFYGNAFADATYRVSTFTSSGAIVDETKTIIQYTRSGTNFKIETYQDGVSKTQVFSGTLSNTTDTLEMNRFGSSGTSSSVNGKMNEMAIFNRGLSSDETDKVIADIKARNSMT
jgi:hypothetical protein